MDLYTLDEGFNRSEIIEARESLIWTERYSNSGDVTLHVPDTLGTRQLLTEGTFLGLSDSEQVMIVETPLLENNLIKVTGPSLVDFLKNRILRDSLYTDSQYWELTGAPGWIAGEIVEQMCAVGGLMDSGAVLPAGDMELIPNLVIGPTATGTSVKIPVKYGNVFDGVKSICDAYGLGFTLYPTNITESDYDLVFTTYEGLDLTSTQDTNPAVIFEPALDSLANTKELRSISGYKNVAYAWAPSIVSGTTHYIGSAFADAASESAVGFERRTLMVEATDINQVNLSDGGTLLRQLLSQRAKDALANNNYVKIVDGEVVPQLLYTFGLDYHLGDLIELRGAGGSSQTARVTEYIRTQDASGERAYPTLSVI